MKCKSFKIRSKNYKKYFYCTVLKSSITFDECRNCNLINNQFPISKPLRGAKSANTTKLERNRFSLFTDDLTKCYLCGSTYKVTKHEIFSGRNRSNSMKYGLVLPLCLMCHTKYQHDKKFNEYWHKKGQTAFNVNYPDLEFIKIFYINYL